MDRWGSHFGSPLLLQPSLLQKWPCWEAVKDIQIYAQIKKNMKFHNRNLHLILQHMAENSQHEERVKWASHCLESEVQKRCWSFTECFTLMILFPIVNVYLDDLPVGLLKILGPTIALIKILTSKNLTWFLIMRILVETTMHRNTDAWRCWEHFKYSYQQKLII